MCKYANVQMCKWGATHLRICTFSHLHIYHLPGEWCKYTEYFLLASGLRS